MADRRAQQAEATRREILAAARRLFVRHGYADTTVAAIAADAGVSVQTIYDRVGSKAALVSQLNDLIDETAGVREIAAEIPVGTDPAALVAIPARITRRIFDTNGDITRVVWGTEKAHAEFDAVREEGTRRHRAGLRMIVDRLGAIGAPLRDPDLDRVTDTIAILAQPETWITLMDRYGWDLGAVEAWVIEATRRLVLET